MKLIEMTLQNFMPYKGQQKVAFPADAKRNVMVVWGDNMRGKTSFLNALRWCFYGEALDRDRNALPLRLLANTDAVAEGDYQFAVYVRFNDGKTKFDLRRVAKPKAHVTIPKANSDFDVEVSLTEDGSVVPSHVIDHKLSRIFPPDTSRFFLFDAELLLEYEDLLEEGTDSSERIRKAIEQVLGVPPLLNGKTTFRTLHKQAQSVLAKEHEHTKGFESQAGQYRKLDEEIGSLSASQAILKQKEHAARAEIAKLEAELSKTEAAQLAQGKRDRLEADIRALTESGEQLRVEKLQVVAGAWRDLLQPRLQAKLGALQEEMDAYKASIENVGALKARIKQLSDLLAQSVCGVCGQSIAAERRATCGHDLGTLQGELAELEGLAPEVGRVSNAILLLQRLQGSGAASRLTRIDSDLGRIALKTTEAEGHLEELEKEVAGFDSAAVATLRAQSRSQTLHLGATQKELRDLEGEIAIRIKRQNELSKLMSKTATARTRRSGIEVQLYRALEELFGGTIDELRERLRKKVASAASSAFSRLSTDKTYKGLQINDSYGLRIIDWKGRAVENRSAGAEQIVAMSLIDGLNRTSGRSAPIVIDTPLSRLDPKHRANVLSYVPEMAEQIVLLVHEGEVPRPGGLGPLAPRIGCEYEIERVTSSHSEIRKCKG